MNTQQVVAQQLAFWQGSTQSMVAECSPEALNRNIEGATVSSIASIYAHAVWSEDTIVNGLLQGKPSIYEAEGWAERTGIPFPGQPPALNPDWARTVKMDLPVFQEYASKVWAGTQAYLGSVSDADLQRKLASPLGEQPAEWWLAMVLATHLPQHAGEIAALKGVHGLKGLPF